MIKNVIALNKKNSNFKKMKKTFLKEVRIKNKKLIKKTPTVNAFHTNRNEE